MAVPFSNTKLRVPAGFRSLVWVLSKEVIRDAPDHVLTYCADFMELLLKIRADTGHNPVEHGAHSEDRFYNNHAFKKNDAQPNAEQGVDPNDPTVQDEAATKIQAQFRGHMVRRNSRNQSQDDSPEEVDKPAQNPGQTEEGVEKPAQNPDQSEEVVDIDLEDPAVRDAASKIQAQFRGRTFGKGSKSQSRSPDRST